MVIHLNSLLTFFCSKLKNLFLLNVLFFLQPKERELLIVSKSVWFSETMLNRVVFLSCLKDRHQKNPVAIFVVWFYVLLIHT